MIRVRLLAQRLGTRMRFPSYRIKSDSLNHVELLEGWITPKMIHNPPHDLAVGLADEAIRARLSQDWKVRTQSAITTQDSQPEPDVVTVKGPLRRYAVRQPGPADIALIVEVADTSLSRDRAKCRLYARAGISCYWIINLDDRQIEVFAHPSGLPDVPSYAESFVYQLGDGVPLEVPGQQACSILAEELLP